MARPRKTKGSLARYHAKRHFAKTPEPRGKVAARHGCSFVVHKHGARRLHYDFRLEWDGTLKSWAVPKGPSLDPGDKRLAVRVEDHPLDYGSFEGVIPEGEYGAGPVIIWDRGTWRPEGDPNQGDAKGRLSFTLDGEKLHGAWSLVRIRGGRYGKRNGDGKNWLLIKRTDDQARRGHGDLLVAKQPNSVKSGRSLEDLRAGGGRARHASREKRNRPEAKPARQRKAAKASDMPDFIPPELATRVDKPPAGGGWLHEVKFDGYRVQARIDGDEIKFLTRTGLDWTERFRTFIPELSKLDVADAIIDGEVVALDEDGISDFSRLQEALSEGDENALHFYVFDLLYRDGALLTREPLEERKAALAELLRPLGKDGRVRLSEHFKIEGGQFLRQVCSMALEGAISKRADARYVSGRSGQWLKSKCVERQEMVIVGFRPSSTGPHAIGSLLLGQYEKGNGRARLVYSGGVGTGFTHKTARMLRDRLRPLETDAAPVTVPGKEKKDARWVRPELVAEIEFVGWTADKIVRHAAFKGLREDKPATEVTKETPKQAMAPAPKAAKGREKLFAVLTHPDRVLYDQQGVTKLGLAEYYVQVAELMLPHVRERPLSLVRCPEGTTGECFFQKSVPQGTPKAVYEVHNTARGKKETYPAIRDLEGLIGLTQMGTLELHIWGCKAAKMMTPDRMVFDVDPDPAVPWKDVIAAAFEIRDRLKKIGLASFLKTTGGKGLHVAAPVAPRHDWDTVKAFAKAVASAMMRDAPERYVVTASKKARKGKIFIDYLRNGYGATFVAPYSPRARPNAPISMPLDWKELTPARRSDQFRLENVAARLKAMKHDPWRGMLKLRQSITAKMLKQFGVA